MRVIVQIKKGVCLVHQLGFETVDQSAESNAAFPRGCQVRNVHILVAVGLFLAPGEKSSRSDLRLCKGKQFF